MVPRAITPNAAAAMTKPAVLKIIPWPFSFPAAFLAAFFSAFFLDFACLRSNFAFSFSACLLASAAPADS